MLLQEGKWTTQLNLTETIPNPYPKLLAPSKRLRSQQYTSDVSITEQGIGPDTSFLVNHAMFWQLPSLNAMLERLSVSIKTKSFQIDWDAVACCGAEPSLVPVLVPR
ncbi:hypothetical protein BCON_0195g00190 [Botryotinia convoluta]|uniref:Uncharacterized protein n=1 Tax=Botryotinia convoluta TaxID=54673 RepID=A0A4Z1HYU3_9HELO|nr:hypothetical protein BCON_0195g00190 [Botryotinia convoluta]